MEVSADAVTLQVVSPALTVAGVATSRFGIGGVGSFAVNGSRSRSNNILIDGTENNDISVAGQAFTITLPDMVQEITIQTPNYDAEFAMRLLRRFSEASGGRGGGFV